MKKIFNIMTTCLSIILFCSCVGCSNQESANQEIIELTKDNWQEYLAYQKKTVTQLQLQKGLYMEFLFMSQQELLLLNFTQHRM